MINCVTLQAGIFQGTVLAFTIYRRNLQILNTNHPGYWLSNMIDMFVSKLHFL
jgi:hypothetical protein